MVSLIREIAKYEVSKSVGDRWGLTLFSATVITHDPISVQLSAFLHLHNRTHDLFHEYLYDWSISLARLLGHVVTLNHTSTPSQSELY